MMEIKEFQEACEKTAKKNFNTKEEEIMTWGFRIAGEAGDVACCIKKTFAHKKNQKESIRENIGDTLWYIASICNFFNWSLKEIIGENVNKLKKRFPKGFTKENADRERINWSE